MKIEASPQGPKERCPVGTQTVVLAACFSIGLQKGFNDKVQDKVVLWFETASKDSRGSPFQIPVVATKSCDHRSNLTAIYATLSGKAMTKEECAKGFDTDDVIGKSALASVKPSNKEGGWPFIDSFIPLPNGMQPLTVCDRWVGGTVPKFVEIMREKTLTEAEAEALRAVAAKSAKAKSREPGQDDELDTFPL